MSPVGDLTLSPGGLRVPARVSSFLQFSAEDLVVGLRRSWASFGDCVVPRRVDAVLGGGVLLRGFPARDSVLFSVEVQYLSVGEFPEEFLAPSQHISFSICVGPGGIAFFVEEGFWGDFWRWSILFMVSGFCSER